MSINAGTGTDGDARVKRQNRDQSPQTYNNEKKVSEEQGPSVVHIDNFSCADLVVLQEGLSLRSLETRALTRGRLRMSFRVKGSRGLLRPMPNLALYARG